MRIMEYGSVADWPGMIIYTMRMQACFSTEAHCAGHMIISAASRQAITK